MFWSKVYQASSYRIFKLCKVIWLFGVPTAQPGRSSYAESNFAEPLINFPAQHSLWPTCAHTTRSFSLLQILFHILFSCQSTIIFCRADQNFPIIQQYGPTFWEYPKSWPDVNVWLPLPSEHTQSVAAVERIARNWSNLALSQNRNGFYLTIRKTQATWSAHYWGALSSPSGDLGIGLVWDILSPTPIQHFGTSVEIFKLSMMGPQLLSGWYQIFLDVQ